MQPSGRRLPHISPLSHTAYGSHVERKLLAEIQPLGERLIGQARRSARCPATVTVFSSVPNCENKLVKCISMYWNCYRFMCLVVMKDITVPSLGILLGHQDRLHAMYHGSALIEAQTVLWSGEFYRNPRDTLSLGGDKQHSTAVCRSHFKTINIIHSSS